MQAGHTETVSLLLASGCGLNRGDVAGASPLLSSVRHGHLATTRVIAAHPEVDLEWTDNERRTALIVAAQLNHVDIVQHLIDAGNLFTYLFIYLLMYSSADSMGHAGHVSPTFTNGWARGEGGTVSRRTASKKLTKLY